MDKMQKKEEFLVIGPKRLKLKRTNALIKKKVDLAFIDGGLCHVKALNLSTKAISFGDGDSSDAKMSFIKKDQNQSDLAFFLEKRKKSKKNTVYHFHGFSGGRLDHELVNLGEIFHFIESMHSKKEKRLAL